MRISCLPAGLIFLSGAALATEGTLDAAGSVLQMLFGLALILGLLYASLHLLKRLGAGSGQGAGLLKLRGATAVGPRERVVLVEVAGKILVLGVAPGRVSTLHTLEADELPAAAPPSPPVGRDFQSWLKQTLERRTR